MCVCDCFDGCGDVISDGVASANLLQLHAQLWQWSQRMPTGLARSHVAEYPARSIACVNTLRVCLYACAGALKECYQKGSNLLSPTMQASLTTTAKGRQRASCSYASAKGALTNAKYRMRAPGKLGKECARLSNFYWVQCQRASKAWQSTHACWPAHAHRIL